MYSVPAAVQPDGLLLPGHLDVLVRPQLRRDVVAHLLEHLADRAARLVLVLIDLALREAPGVALPPLDEEQLGALLVEDHRAARWDL
jgi:hypothetical protein